MTSLVGIRVVEVTTDVAGPYAGMVFADLGAEVVKVEDTKVNPDRDVPLFRAAKFIAFNRNKKSVAIDLKSNDGKEAALRLIGNSDVFIENLNPGVADSLGLSYEVLSKLNPGIVYISIRGYLPGPYGNWPAVDSCIESLSGLTSTTGEPEPQIPGVVGLTEGRIPLTGNPPLVLSQPSIPCGAAIYGVIGAVGALLNRVKTGRGDKIVVGMLETGVSLVEQHLSAFALYGVLGKHTLDLRRSKDGWALIPLGRWDQFVKAFDVSKEVAQEFATREAREMNAEKLNKLVDDIISKLSSNEIRERLTKGGMDGAALGAISELPENEHLKAIKNFVPLTPDPEVTLTPDRKTALCAMFPIRTSNYTPEATSKWTPAPKLGENTAEVLRAVGYTEGQIADLGKRGIIRA